jgi:hypothetical protein
MVTAHPRRYPVSGVVVLAVSFRKPKLVTIQHHQILGRGGRCSDRPLTLALFLKEKEELPGWY